MKIKNSKIFLKNISRSKSLWHGIEVGVRIFNHQYPITALPRKK